MRAIVTGGAGFIGSAVCRRLARTTGWQVLNVDKLTYAANLASLEGVEGAGGYSFIQGDICDRALVDRTFAEFRPEVIFHLAAESHVDRSITGSAAFVQTNVVGTHTLLEAALAYWKTLFTDEGAHFDKVVMIKGEDIAPVVTWGTSPEDVLPITGVVPNPVDFTGGKVEAVQRSLDYMGLVPGQKLSEIAIDTVFIGSCTNGRIEDLRAAAAILKGKKIAVKRAMVVPGSGLVRAQAEEEGLAQIFLDAGFEWRLAGCSMCLAMNPDQLAPGERCAATSNRNFEGRQGRGGRTHLLSPAMAAAAAITGRLTDVRELMSETA